VPRLAALALSFASCALLYAAPTGGSLHVDEPRVGPVADFGPHRVVMTHKRLDTMGTGLATELSRALGPRHVVSVDEPVRDEHDEAGTLLWMRDFTPIFVRTRDGGLRAVTYLHENGARMGFHAVESDWIWLPDDRRRSRGEWYRHDELPLLHENGNLVSTGRYVFVAETLFDDNAEEYVDPSLVQHGFRRRDPSALYRILEHVLELPPERVVRLPALPGEGTGHVDAYVLALGPRSVAIPEIRDEAIAAGDDGLMRLWVTDVAEFLDEQADAVRERGLLVTRLPMVAPRLEESIHEGHDADILYFTPANSFLTTGPAHAYAFVPSFVHSELLSDEEREIELRYEAEWADVFDEHGYEARFADAGSLAEYLGVFRCVTAFVPQGA
jgi:hypothetical protein